MPSGKQPLSTYKVLTDEHYKAIGKIAVEWTYVELDIQSIIWHMLDLVTSEADIKSGHAITAQLGSEARLDLLKTLVHNKTGETDEYTALCAFIEKDLKNLRTLRNEIIHGLYYRSPEFPDKAALHQIKAKGRLKFNFTKRSLAELEDIAQQMADLRDSLDRLPVWKQALPKKYVGPHR